MRSVRFAGWIALACMLMGPADLRRAEVPDAINLAGLPQNDGGLSVMTFNVKGLPWPIATGRGPALAAIGARLADMRSAGTQPQVLLLQEAFTDEAKAIAASAGYRYVAYGPQNAATVNDAPLGKNFAAAARWDRGERSGPVLDSGLMILSDFPIVESRRFAFPDGACAGFDCLAAKGVMIAWIAVPGHDQPIAIANTHLNSRGATHVALERADAAQLWQMQALERLLVVEVDPATPLILGGDLNIGDVPERIAGYRAHRPLGTGQRDASLAMAERAQAGALWDLRPIVEHNKDLVLYRHPAGSRARLAPRMAAVPFPLVPDELALSDHAGFMFQFSWQ